MKTYGWYKITLRSDPDPSTLVVILSYQPSLDFIEFGDGAITVRNLVEHIFGGHQ